MCILRSSICGWNQAAARRARPSPRHRVMRSWRNVAVLAAAQALAASGGPLVTLAGGIVGQTLAPSPLLATLPITALVIGVAMSAVPAALLMRRIGRRAGFMTGAAISSVGALLAAAATAQGGFAASSVSRRWSWAPAPPSWRSTGSPPPSPSIRGTPAVRSRSCSSAASSPACSGRRSAVTAGSGSAPSSAAPSSWSRCPGRSRSSCSARSGMPPPTAPATPVERLPLRTFLARPAFVLAMVSAAAAYAVMSFVMTATPISMHVHDRTFARRHGVHDSEPRRRDVRAVARHRASSSIASASRE